MACITLRALVAHVAGIDSAVLRRGLRQRHHLFRIRIRAGNVNQSGGESDRAVPHGLLDQRLHFLNLFRRRLPVRRAHHRAAHAIVPDQRADIQAQAELFDLANQAARFTSEPPQLPVITVVTPSSR